MEKSLDLKLISGEFNPKDAKEILINLVNDKLNFHVRKNFSSTIRFGAPDENSAQRITELNGELRNIMEFFDQMDMANGSFSINATIELRSIETKEQNI